MLPDGDKIAGRNRRRREADTQGWGSRSYRLVCKSCGVVMVDLEPCARGGEHIHPRTVNGELSKCPHAGEGVFHPHEYPGDRRGSRWVEVFRPKKYRRARARARKAVKKLGRS